MSKLEIGDKVNFIVERSLLKGVITKFYKSCYNRDECSVRVDFANGSKSKIFAHIELHRVTKINDDEKDQQIAELKKQLHTQPREIVEKIKSKMDNTVDTLINLGNGKEDAVAWFCGILQEILKEYGGEE